MKQGLTEGIETMKPSEVSLEHTFFFTPFFRSSPSFTSLCDVFLPVWSCDLSLVCPSCRSLIHSALPKLPPNVISPHVGLRLVLIWSLLSCRHFHPSPLFCFTTLPPSQPAPKMNSRWTTEEQLLAVQGK